MKLRTAASSLETYGQGATTVGSVFSRTIPTYGDDRTWTIRTETNNGKYLRAHGGNAGPDDFHSAETPAY